ncbi:MAG: hypothetical protein AMJ53_04035 [Gammaproteobacteria bacterium SG8_11]|nr:MAG: hypothetical protein AMJ53_04035 [Gammaproteobacteria bacterium SG8_11]
MALKATIFKVDLQIADMNRNYYRDHTLTIASHPSENDERMMARILAFALHADDNLEFTKGLSTEDEPDLWQKNLRGDVELWIELGQVDARRIRKACANSNHVLIYTYNPKAAEVWWRQIRDDLTHLENLTVIGLPEKEIKSLTQFTERTMRLQCTIQDEQVWISDSRETVCLHFNLLKQSGVQH